MNAYEKSIELGLTGTDAENVAVLKSVTLSPMPTAKLRVNLRTNGLLIFGATIKGILVDLQIPNLDLLIDALTDPDTNVVNTHTQEWGPDFDAVVSGLLAAGEITQAESGAVFALGGGQPYSNLTMIEFANQRNANTKQEEMQAALYGVSDKANKANEAAETSYMAGDTPAQITAAGQSGWEL